MQQRKFADMLLERAIDYERKAAALREVALDLNLSVRHAKRNGLNGTMAKAVALRAEQRNGREHAQLEEAPAAKRAPKRKKKPSPKKGKPQVVVAPDGYIPTTEAAKQIGVSSSRLYQIEQEGRFKAKRRKGRVFIAEEDLKRLIAERV